MTEHVEVLTESLWNRREKLQALLERTQNPSAPRVESAPRARQRQKHLNPEERAEVVRRYEAGESMGELAASFGCHRSAIKRALEADDVVLRDWRTRLVNVDRAVAMYESGETAQRIADELGVSPTAVLNQLRSAGVVLRPKGKVAGAR